MSQPNQPPQNYEITSPTLENQVKTLLPSVAGYGGLLRATNTIVPVIDLTSSAEGSNISETLQTALAFQSQTAFTVDSATVTIANVAGFYRCFGISNVFDSNASNSGAFQLKSGSTTKTILKYQSGGPNTEQFDFVVFLDSGESLIGVSTNANYVLHGSVRQIATSTGTLVNPGGFTS